MARLPFLPLALLALLAACNGDKAASTSKQPAGPVIRDGSLMEPGRPQLTGLPAVVAPGVHAVGWNMWWGENGSQWVLYVNGGKIGSGSLQADSPREQAGLVEVPLDQAGRYEIKVSLCNDHGCSDSEPAVVEVSAPVEERITAVGTPG